LTPASIASALPHKGPLIIAASVSALGGLLFGYDNIVISGAIHYLALCFKLDAAGIGWAAGCALIGCTIGAAGAGAVVDRAGLKKGLALCAACFALSSLGMWFASSLTQFVIWRLIGGLGIGAASIIAPMYIAEIAPARLRGRLVTLYQLGIVLGILAAVFVNLLIQRIGDEAWNTSVGWRWMFFVGVVPALLFGLTIVPAVESPRWLMKMGRQPEALSVLSKINDRAIALGEAARIQDSLSLEEGHISELFTTFRRPLLIGIMLAGFSQLSGITPLFSFLPEIFRSAGTATSDAFFQSVLVSLVNLIFTLFALWLVDLSGRKKLSRSRQRPGRADFRDDLRGRSRLRKRRCLLGHHFRDLSDQGPRARHVHCYNRLVGGGIPGQSKLSPHAEAFGQRRYLLVFQRGRPAESAVRALVGAGN
jgi:SP family arabinose:H+ symporter-like MFS transporter